MQAITSWRAIGASSIAVAALAIQAAAARANYVLQITGGGASPSGATVSPGDAITLLVLLAGSSEDEIDSLLFDVEFSVPGLFYES